MNKEELIFCPLGGSGEIGMNMNLYAYGKKDDKKWIIVDMGVTFADDSIPGIDLIMPDPGFITDKTFIFESFNLYTGLDSLYTIFSNEIFLLLFWFHFLALNFFLGSWISKDALKFNISKRIVFFPLVFVYFTGPLGLFLYWLIRIFYAKKISLYD